MSTLKLGQRIRVFEVVKNCYGERYFRVGRQYCDYTDYCDKSYTILISETPQKIDLAFLTPSEAKQVGTLVIKKIK